MDGYRHSLDEQLRQLRMHAHDSFENQNHPTARIFHDTLRQAEEMNQSGRGLRDVHNKLEAAQRLLRESHNTPHDQQIMSPTHVADFEHRIEHLRVDIRKQDHYV